MCLAIPGKIKSIEGQKVIVQYPGEERQVMLGGVDVQEGDWVMVQMGVVMQKLDESEAKQMLEGWGE